MESMATHTTILESEIKVLNVKLHSSEQTNTDCRAEILQLTSKLDGANKLIAKLESEVLHNEALRKKLHNTIQELKGNIRVFCRVRPFLPRELGKLDAESAMKHIRFPGSDEGAIELVQESETISGKASITSYPFTFDRVFGPRAKQADVFDEISQLVQSALDGFRVCIFAYGQTGSGKTHTMEGPSDVFESREEMGMIPRAIYQIFEAAERLKPKGWSYTMDASFLEIYNETIRDLLCKADDSKKHEIKHNAANGTTTVTNLTSGISSLLWYRGFIYAASSVGGLPGEGFSSSKKSVRASGCCWHPLQ